MRNISKQEEKVFCSKQKTIYGLLFFVEFSNKKSWISLFCVKGILFTEKHKLFLARKSYKNLSPTENIF